MTPLLLSPCYSRAQPPRGQGREHRFDFPVSVLQAFYADRSGQIKVEHMQRKIKVAALDHLVLTVADTTATLAFYTEILGMTAQIFTPADGSARHALCFGAQKINLHPADAPFDPKAAHPGPGTADLCFLSDTPLGDWQDHLAATGITIENGPVPRTGATGPIMSLYLRDPDGNLIEISNAVV